MKHERNPDEYKYWEQHLQDIMDWGTMASEDYPQSAEELEEGGLGDAEVTDFSSLKEDNHSLYSGVDVIWDGYAGQMVRVPAEYVESMDLNEFDDSKLLRVQELVNEASNIGRYVRFDAPIVRASLIELSDVAESQRTWEEEDTWDGLDRPLSTGDEELDNFLKDPEEWTYLELGLEGEPELLESPIFEEMYEKDYVRKWSDKHGLLHFLWQKWNAWSKGELAVSSIEEAFFNVYKSDFSKYGKSIGEPLEMARTIGTGDIGKVLFSVKNGNHRAFGALATGEPYFWGILDDPILIKMKDAVFHEGKVVGSKKKKNISDYDRALLNAVYLLSDRSKGVKLK